jgi:hypothetical protein
MGPVIWEEIGDELLAVGAYWYEEAGTGIKPGDPVKVLCLLGYMSMRDFCNPVMNMLDRSDVWRSVWD